LRTLNKIYIQVIQLLEIEAVSQRWLTAGAHRQKGRWSGGACPPLHFVMFSDVRYLRYVLPDLRLTMATFPLISDYSTW